MARNQGPARKHRKLTCPICRRHINVDATYDVHLSDLVCEGHQNWVVTTCERCHRTCFSDAVGICLRCMNEEEHDILARGSGDHRYWLRAYGQESIRHD